jgi:hypothetical protein
MSQNLLLLLGSPVARFDQYIGQLSPCCHQMRKRSLCKKRTLAESR